jgi:hypothetical protein
MSGRIFIDNNIITIFPFKIGKQVYWITTPHSCYLNREEKYSVIYKNKKYIATLFKHAFWCDLAVFLIDDFTEIIHVSKIIKSFSSLKSSQLIFKNKSGLFLDYSYPAYLDINGGCRSLMYQCTFKSSVIPGDSGTPIYNKENELIGIISHHQKFTYLVPSFFISKIINNSNEVNQIIPYLPLKLTLEKDLVKVLNNSDLILKDDIILSVDGNKLNKGNIFNTSVKTQIPFDVYLLSLKNPEERIKLEVLRDNKKIEIELKVDNQNKYLKYPFNPDKSITPSYHSLCHLLDDKEKQKEILKELNNSLVIK